MHGLVMFTWVGLFLTQVALIVWHRPLWHRRLGVIGMGVAALVGSGNTWLKFLS